MSDVALLAAERYEKFANITFEEAMLIVTEQKPPLPGTEKYLDVCVDWAFKECIGDGR